MATCDLTAVCLSPGQHEIQRHCSKSLALNQDEVTLYADLGSDVLFSIIVMPNTDKMERLFHNFMIYCMRTGGQRPSAEPNHLGV